jgi:hypothetical protein
MDDGVGDTPKQRSYYYGQPTYPKNSCSSSDMFMNFLDYVDDKAMNLFTKGQKNVMHNVLNNERIGLLTSNGCQAPQPVVMFRSTSMMTLEGTRNCNSTGQNKYTVWLDIAAPPSRTATVNIKTAGSAIEGEDYTLSRRSVSFAAGRSQGQSFDIILKEDGYVESMKDIKLSFTVSANGGNAKAGQRRQHYSLDMLNDDLVAQAAGVMIRTIGNNMGSSVAPSPFKGASTDARTEVIISANDLKTSGMKAGWLTALSLFINQKNSSRAYSNFTIKLDLTDQNTFPKYATFKDGLVQVFKRSISSNTGKTRLAFDQPFWWDGQSNIRIQFCYDNSVTSGNDFVKYETTSPSKKTLFEKANSGSGCTLNSMPERSEQRPIIEFELNYGSDIATAFNQHLGYAESEIGPYKTVHFYDMDNGKVMLSLENLSGHDYGCTRVEIDETGGSHSALWGSSYDRTSKSFKITPQFNNRTGRYRITTYFTKDEITTWERHNRLGQNKYQLLTTKCPESISTSTGTGCQSLPASIRSFGNHYAFESEVSTGFSGFTLSNWPNAPLAIRDIKLDGKKSDDLIQLTVDVIGIPENDVIEVFRKNDEGQFLLWKTIQAENINDLTLIDGDTEMVTDVYYQARCNTGTKSIQSNIVHFNFSPKWRAYHSSTDRHLSIKAENDSQRFAVFNNMGQLIHTTNLAAPNIIDTRLWINGVYFITSISGSDKKYQTILIQ